MRRALAIVWLSAATTAWPARADADGGPRARTSQQWLSPADAIERAGGGRAELIVLARPLGPPRLAYRVLRPRDLARGQTIQTDIDALTGRVLARRNLVRAALAQVYRENPVATPEIEVVELTGLPAGATDLASPDVSVFGCPDALTCREVFDDTFFHACEPTALAIANIDGDFVDHGAPADDTEPDDPFAEVQAFFHVTAAYEAIRALGGPGPVAMPLTVIANYKGFDPASLAACDGTVYSGSSGLPRFDNALFAPAGTPGIGLAGDILVLGQGRNLDYAYDGDVVAHEFGHAVMRAVAPELGDGFVDEHGFNPTPDAMHEAYADMVTLFVTSDPVIGDYVMDSIASSGRDLDNDATCPRDIVGVPHPDSLPLSGALYEARVALAGDELGFDRAVFAAQRAFDASSDFGTAAARTVIEVEAELGTAAAGRVAAVFERRGIDDCDDRVIDAVDGKSFFILPGSDPAEAIPGPFQFRYDLVEAADDIAIDISLYDVDVTDPELIAASIALKPGDQPIAWIDDGDRFIADAAATVPVVFASDRSAHSAIAGPFEPGVYHLQLINDGVTARVRGIAFSHTASSSGCGCSTGSGDAGSLLGALIVALAIARSRRRRVTRA